MIEIRYPDYENAVKWAKKEFGDWFLDTPNFCAFSVDPGREPQIVFFLSDMQWVEVHIFVRNCFFDNLGQPNAPYRIPDPPPSTFEKMLDLRSDHPDGWLKAFKKEPYYDRMKKAYEGFAARLVGKKKSESIEDLLNTDRFFIQKSRIYYG